MVYSCEEAAHEVQMCHQVEIKHGNVSEKNVHLHMQGIYRVQNYR